MENEIQLIGGVRRTDKQLLYDIIWRAWHRTKHRISRKVNLWNYVSYNRMKGRNEL